jgi:succinate dehydrogenase subunit C
MSTPGHTAYQAPEAGPRPYRKPVGVLWWLRKRSYTFFVLREISAVFVAWTVVFVLMLVRALAQGEPEYRAFLDWAGTPWVVALNVVTLAFLVLHAVTWFDLTPAAMVVRVGGRRLPPQAVAGGAYAAWVVVSALVAWLVLR